MSIHCKGATSKLDQNTAGKWCFAIAGWSNGPLSATSPVAAHGHEQLRALPEGAAEGGGLACHLLWSRDVPAEHNSQCLSYIRSTDSPSTLIALPEAERKRGDRRSSTE